MILASCHNTMRHAVPVFDEESPEEMARQRLAAQRDVERQRRLWTEAIDRAKAARKPRPACLVQHRVDELFRAMPPWVREIVHAIIAKHDTDPAKVFFKRTRGPARCARNEICYVLKGTVSPMTGEQPSLQMIGRWVNREHTAVVHAIANHQHENDVPVITARDAEKKRRRSREWHKRQRGGGK